MTKKEVSNFIKTKKARNKRWKDRRKSNDTLNADSPRALYKFRHNLDMLDPEDLADLYNPAIY